MKAWKKYLAEGIGTLVLTYVGCGTAQLICNTTHGFGGYVGTALAFGLCIVALSFIIGPISGCHVNPAISLALFMNKKMSAKDFGFYVLSQFIGALVAGGGLVLTFFLIRGAHPAIGSNMLSTELLLKPNAQTGSLIAGYVIGFCAEVVLTGLFVLAVLAITSKAENGKVAGFAIGGTLTLVHLIGIGLTGTSVNPARSFGPAIFAMVMGNFKPVEQIWIFLLAPFAGAALAALLWKFVLAEKEEAK